MKESLYKFATNRKTRLKNRGFNYKGKIFERSMSPVLFNEQTRADILGEYEKIIYFLVEKVKLIKTFYNYTVDKDYSEIN
jgi:hypothetical protein